MDQLFTSSRVRVKKDAVIRVKRSLPQGKGRISIMTGQEVSPGDIIGEGQSSAGFRSFNLAHELRVSPKQALRFLKRPLGQIIYQGELLAAREVLFGLRRKIFLSPVDGLVDYYDEGSGILRIKLLPKVSKLASGVYGIVEEINPTTGTILIKTVASIIYGVFGSGREREGIIRVLGRPDELISSRQITEQMRGQIVVGGSLVFQEALEQAISSRVVGIISGGTNSCDYRSMVGGDWNLFKKHWSDVGLTLMVTEGFGSIPIGDDIFELLQEYDRRFGIMDGNRARLILPSGDPNSIALVRRTRLPVSTTVEPALDIDLAALQVGGLVRLVSPPGVGRQGKIVAIDETPTLLPSGLKSTLVTVSTQMAKFRVPYQNLEIIA